jgi:hypothetical protein
MTPDPIVNPWLLAIRRDGVRATLPRPEARTSARPAVVLLILATALAPGCVYHMGRNLTAGMLDEAIGENRTGGIDQLGDRILEKQLAAELGEQLGSGLTSGATDLSPEQVRQLDDLIDGLLTTATVRGADGIRHNLSPAMRDMVKHDIVEALRDGLRDDVGPQLEDTADKVVTRAILALRRGLEDPETHFALSEALADSFYMAMREGGRSPAMEETLQGTLDQAVLSPFADTVGGITDNVSLKFEEQSRRTENTMRAIIAFLAVVLAVFLFMYLFAQRQLSRERKTAADAEAGLRNVGAAIELLDEDTRNRVLGSIGGAATGSGHQKSAAKKVEPPPGRSDDYFRK